jgi:hypothetical protein
VLNPVRAVLCRHPNEWAWSSYRASARLAPPRPPQARDELLALFADMFGTSPENAHLVYRRFVEARLEIERQWRVSGATTDLAVAPAKR